MTIRRLVFRRKADAVAATLGNEPPLVAGDTQLQSIDRRSVSLRWLGGTVMTGIAGALLMAGAVYAALDGPFRIARIVNPPQTNLKSPLAPERVSNTARKSNKLSLVAETLSAKQTIRVSMTTKVGDREIIKVRPFTRVTAALSLTATKLSADIPAFNPLNLFADDTPQTVDPTSAETDGDLAIVTRDLTTMDVKPAATAVPMDEVMQRVREAVVFEAPPAALAYAPAAIAPNDPRLSPTLGAPPSVAQTNVSIVEKKPGDDSTRKQAERTVVVKPGETLLGILLDNGVARADAQAIVQAAGTRYRDAALAERQIVRILFALVPENGIARLRPVRALVSSDQATEMAVALADDGRYVAVAEAPKIAKRPADEEDEEEEEDDGDNPSARLYNSLYETALRHEIPRPIIDELVRIYAFDIDFNRRVKPGDTFEVFFSGDEEGETAGRGEILYAALTTGSQTRRYFRFQAPDDGSVDYYDETGKSAKKFLIRKPINGGIMRSTFGYRRHPILGYSKLHTGVDWADKIGTPILAAGNGVVIKAGWTNGYGRRIEIQHANGYVTTYSHMSVFARGIVEGTRVRLGQVIGYVGSTGLSTGPHLHYEVKVNDRFVDPLRVRLPRGRELDGPIFAAFKKERDRIEAMMNRAPASTKLAGG